MKQNIVLMDGAVGTSLWEKAEARKIAKDPVWKYNVEHPELVTELTGEYIDAGSQIILANTFGANRAAVQHSSDYSVEQVVRAGVRLAKKVAVSKEVRVALSAGPLSMLLEPYGDMTEDEAADIYEEQIGSGMEEEPDCILLQTFMDLKMMQVAVRVAKQYHVPVFCAMTFEKVGKTMMGNSVQDIIDGLSPMQIDAIGMNCSLGPDLALPIIEEFSKRTDLPLLYKPNAGKPIVAADGTTQTAYDASVFADDIEPALDYVTYIGGCCGSNVEYIREIKKRIVAKR